MSKIHATSLRTYLLKRILQLIVVFFAIIIFNFIIIHMAPGDPAVLFVGENAVTPEYLAQVRHEFGLDQPLYTQLAIYLGSILQGNLGYSYYYKQPVVDVLVSKLPATLYLTLPQAILATLIGIWMGVRASRKLHSKADYAITTMSLIGCSLPVFWTGQLLVMFFGLYLGWLPVSGMVSVQSYRTGGLPYVLDLLRHLILPVTTLTVFNIGLTARITRNSMLETLPQDYIRTAESKGLPRNVITYKHALRNALIPVVTVIGLNFSWILGGAVLTETVFSYPGLGWLMFDAVLMRDYPILLGEFIFMCIFMLVVNLITDIIYVFIDPRIRYR